MQTKPKQKLTVILIVFTMILTTMIQICIPINVHAEEFNGEDNTPTTYGGQIANVDLEQIYKSGSDYSFNADYYINSNLPFKLVLIKTIPVIPTEDKKEDIFSYLLLENIDNLSMTYNVSVSNIGKDANYSDGFKTYNSSDCSVITNQNNKEYYYIDLKQFVNYESVESSETYDSNFCHSTFMNYDYLHTITYQNGCDPTVEDKLQVLQDIVNGKIESNPDTPTWIELDKNGTYSEEIPTPKIKVSSNLDYTFENGQSDYFYEVRGRWRSIDNITVNNYNQILSKGQIYYKTVLKGDLLWWITANDKKSILETGNLTEIGNVSFNNFITKHPIDSRTIVASGNGFYNPFDESIPIDSVKTSLKLQSSAMNSFEVYIRYYKIDDKGNYIYGKWSHYYNNLIENGFTGKFIRDYWGGIEDTHYQSQNGLTKDELENVENLDDSLNDSDITTITNPNDTLDSELDFSKLTKVLMSLYEQAKTIFSMYGTVFNFLPEWVINIISVSFVIVCFVGIWKVIR